MHTRALGRELQVSAIGLGCMEMPQSYGPNPGDRRAMMTVLRDAVNLGGAGMAAGQAQPHRPDPWHLGVHGNRYNDLHMGLVGR